MKPPDRSKRVLLIAAGVTFGMIGACIYHDTCIQVNSPGTDWCRHLAGAKQWNAAEGGTFATGTPIIGALGCECFNDADDQILRDQEPVCQYGNLLDPMETKARQACVALVNPGWTSNCWTTSGPQASTIETEIEAGVGECIGDCEVVNPPVGGSCQDPNPYECAGGDTGGGDDGCPADDGGEADDGGDGLDETGTMMLLGSSIDCDGRECEVDAAFAQSLYDDPGRLLGDRARLEYDSTLQRHVFVSVGSGDIAYELGLRTNDILESVDGMTIEDLDTGLEVYAELEGSDEIVVRVKRGTSWIDFTYTFVP